MYLSMSHLSMNPVSMSHLSVSDLSMSHLSMSRRLPFKGMRPASLVMLCHVACITSRDSYMHVWFMYSSHMTHDTH